MASVTANCQSPHLPTDRAVPWIPGEPGRAITLLPWSPWPGNVRELEYVVSRAALKAVGRGARRTDIVTLGPELLDLDLDDDKGEAPPPIDSDRAGSAAVEWRDAGAEANALPLRAVIDAAQREAIRQALAASADNWSLAARRLELDPSNLHKLARRLGLN